MQRTLSATPLHAPHPSLPRTTRADKVRFAVVVAASIFCELAQAQLITRNRPDELLSVQPYGTGQYAIFPTISDDGRFVAYLGSLGATSGAGVYLLDRDAPADVARIAENCDAAPVCQLRDPRISGNGRFVVFDSTESYNGEQAVDGSDQDVFRWDRLSGTVLRISTAYPGAPADSGDSHNADVSRDGRFVAFLSEQDNLVSTPDLSTAPTRFRAYWKDLQNDVTKLVQIGASPEGDSYDAVRITSNGRYVLARRATFLGPQIVNWDSLTGATIPISPTDDWGGRFTFAMTSDRRHLTRLSYFSEDDAYQASVCQVTSDNSCTSGLPRQVTGLWPTIQGLDLSSGAGYLAMLACGPVSGVTYAVIEIQQHGGSRVRFHPRLAWQPDSCSTGFDMTPDGRYVVTALWDMDVNGPDPFDDDSDQGKDVFLFENPLWRPAPRNLVGSLASIPADSRNVKVSTDGSIGVFESEIPASQFDPAYVDTNGTTDVFRYLADFQQIELVSTADGTTSFAGGARNAVMSADGETIVFEAPDIGIAANNLRPDATLSARKSYKAGTTSIFLRRLVQNQLQRVSTSRSGGPANGSSMHATISPGGTHVAFATDADNVNPGADPNAVRDVVAVELATGTRLCVSTCGAVVADGPSDHPSVGDNGDIAFESSASTVQRAAGLLKASPVSQIVLRSVVRGASQVISRSPGGQAGDGASTRASISRAGNVVAYQSNASNLDASGNDGRTNVIRYAVGPGNVRISRPPALGGKAATAVNGDSVRPAVSGDGRFTSFQTAASNLAAVDANGVVDLIVHDGRHARLLRLADGFGGAQSNGASETPHLNHNGTVVGFHSYATNLDAETDASTASSVAAPYERDNPLAEDVVFAHGFE